MPSFTLYIGGQVMKLSVVIPYYQDERIKGLITMLKKQTLSKNEFNVLIVDDFSKKPLKIEDLDIEDLNVKIYRLDKNYGAGLARAKGLYECDSEYITFIDSDDLIFDYTLKDLLDNIGDCDILASNFIEEHKKDGELVGIQHIEDKTWMHGKLYKVSYLKENHINFHPYLRYNEDGYFNTIAFACTTKIMLLNKATYLWQNNQNSTVRKNGCEYNFIHFIDYIKSQEYACYNLYKRDNEHLMDIALGVLFYIYYYLTALKKWKTTKYKKYYDECINEFKKFYSMFGDLIKYCPYDRLCAIFSISRAKVENGRFIERLTFKQFIKGLGLKSYKQFD